MTFYSDTHDIPALPGPTTDRLVAVRFLSAVTWGGRVEMEINTMRRGHEGFTIRVRSVGGMPFVAVDYQGQLRLVPWSNVRDAMPHPDFCYPEGAVVQFAQPAEAEDSPRRRGRPPKAQS